MITFRYIESDHACDHRHRHEAVAKAVKGFPSKKEYQILHRIADDMVPTVSANLTKGLKKFSNHVNLHDVVAAVRDKDWAKVESLVPVDKLPDDVKELKAVYQDGVGKAGNASVKFFRKAISSMIPEAKNPLAAFDMTNPRIERYLNEGIANLVKNVTESTKNSIRDVVASSFQRAQTVDQMAMSIKRSIPLHPRQTRALINYENGLIEANLQRGLGPVKAWERAQPLVDRYADELLTYRSKLIARTETIRAVNGGQQEVWEQAADLGLIDKDRVKREWIVTPDDKLCEWCEPMAGVKVGIDESFDVPEIGTVDTPPAHPNCRCAMGLVFE